LEGGVVDFVDVGDPCGVGGEVVGGLVVKISKRLLMPRVL
jgi:hypothetical protein